MTFQHALPGTAADGFELMRDHRARMAFARDQAIERRRRAIEDQRCTSLTAPERVARWEHLHQIRLPTNPDHQILVLVAQHTGLRMDEVRDVQRERLARSHRA